jgi:hypothetical protein
LQALSRSPFLRTPLSNTGISLYSTATTAVFTIFFLSL